MNKVEVDYKLNIDYTKHFDTWITPLKDLLASNYMYNLMLFIHEIYKTPHFPRPRKSEIFEVFQKVPFNNVRVVILVDEPFNTPKGSGIALATRDDEILRPSHITEMVEKCIETSIYKGFNISFDPTLEHWLNQGVLPLHASLTTKFLNPGQHTKLWKEFTRSVIKSINDFNPGIIFILIGKEVSEYQQYISEHKHYVLKYHSPQYAFKNKLDWNCPCFRRANEILIANNGPEAAIQW